MKTSRPGRRFEIIILVIAFLVIFGFVLLFMNFLKAMEGFNLTPT